MRRPAVALIDGEHYPAVVRDALGQAGDIYDFRCALFVGGAEKVVRGVLESDAEDLYGLPVVFDEDPVRGLARAIRDFNPAVVVDLSDEPVLGYEDRFRLISESLARNVDYVGSDFHFNPADRGDLCKSPSLSVIGTGKRVGKTAICGYAARVIQEVMTGSDGHPGVVVVAMGRGGPAEPVVVDGTSGDLTVADLLRWSREGRHAASDYIEDALLGRVVTIGCRRCGGGMAGEPFVSNVADGVEVANGLRPGLLLLEGSGAAVPPVRSDARLLVAGAHQPVDHITGYLGRYRLLTSDALVLTMAEEPLASEAKVEAVLEAVEQVKPGMDVVPVVFRPRPIQEVRGCRVAYFSTAPATQKEALGRYLEEEWGCEVVVISTALADRTALTGDLARREMADVDTVLTEIKAAAIDVVAEAADARGLRVVPVNNVPVEASGGSPGRLTEVVMGLLSMARERFRSRT
jgi:cyclic 2,3-diphosphoglycerate synthetase